MGWGVGGGEVWRKPPERTLDIPLMQLFLVVIKYLRVIPLRQSLLTRCKNGIFLADCNSSNSFVDS